MVSNNLVAYSANKLLHIEEPVCNILDKSKTY